MRYTKDQLSSKLKDMVLTKCADNIVCIYGFIKLLDTYHLILVTKSSIVAEMHRHVIHTIDSTITIPLSVKSNYNADESRYRAIINKVNFTNGYFFSFTYDLTNNMQKNCILTNGNVNARSDNIDTSCKGYGSGKVSFDNTNEGVSKCNDMFAWNYYAAQPFLSMAINRNSNRDNYGVKWVVPVIFGFIQQFSFGIQRFSTGKYDVRSVLILFLDPWSRNIPF